MVRESYTFTKNRSQFWLRVNVFEDGNLHFVVAREVSRVALHHIVRVCLLKPKSWKFETNEKGQVFSKVWIPASNAIGFDIAAFISWAEFAGNQCVWLKPKHQIEGLDGSELDYCIAGDFNFEQPALQVRTALGEAEYLLKYKRDTLSSSEVEQYEVLLSNTLHRMYHLLPLDGQALLSPIPTDNDGTQKMAWKLTENLAKLMDVEFLSPVLSIPKPSFKGLTLDQKTAEWQRIYQHPNPIKLDASAFQNRDVVIVDDLYQSGTTMRLFAKYLKGAGARNVFGLACVKSMRDSDNQ